MTPESEQRALAAIVREARYLLEDQRRALRRADFPDLLAIASAFHRLAERLGALPLYTTTADSSVDVAALRDEILRQKNLFDATLATIARPPRAYGRSSGSCDSCSLLLDHYT
jgi:hypothetical protein